MPSYPSYYGPSFQQFPQQFAQGGINPQALQMILAYLAANQPEQGQEPMGQGQPNQFDAYRSSIGQGYAPPMPTGLSPLGRFNDMALRQSANLANRLADGKQAVAESTERQRLVDSITHPPPTAPYSITSGADTGSGEQYFPYGAPLSLKSKYGTGSVSFAPPGTVPHGTFGPDRLPFGQIGGPHEAQPLPGEDPEQTTFQQQMIMDSIHKALGRKR